MKRVTNELLLLYFEDYAYLIHSLYLFVFFQSLSSTKSWKECAGPGFKLTVVIRIWIDPLFPSFKKTTKKLFFHSVHLLLVDVVSCLTLLKLILWCFPELLLFVQAYFGQYLIFGFVLSAAMQQVLDNLTDLPTSTGAEEIDLIFLKGIMENPIVRSLAKVFKLAALSRIWKYFHS